MQFPFNIQIPDGKANSLSSVALAFVGDAVQTLYVRSRLVAVSDCKTEQLHKCATDRIKAKTQSEKVNTLIEHFTEQEQAIYKRARNTRLRHFAKNASVMEYRRATGLEAVLGYLYLSGDYERLNEFLEHTYAEEN